MRLLNTRTYLLEEFVGKTPRYAILSHRWGAEETTYQDYRKQRGREKQGYIKVIQACDFARSRSQDWLWVDTCCIDKKSSAELSEAVNSMYDWYREAKACYAYLADVPPPSESSFHDVERGFLISDWFTRGWTLQELLAPSLVVFCARNWEVIGLKSTTDFYARPGRGFAPKAFLNHTIGEITGIPEDVLCNPSLVRRRSVAQRLSWAAKRQTTRVEDQAYCLLGLLGVNMPLLYGERNKAFIRLQQEILRNSLDESLLAWSMSTGDDPRAQYCMLAASPSYFSKASTVVRVSLVGNPRFMLVGGGLLEFRPDESSEIFQTGDITYTMTIRCLEDSLDCSFAHDGNDHDLNDSVNGRCSYPGFRLDLILNPCGHFERIHRPKDSNKEHNAVTAPGRAHIGVIYMHASSQSRCMESAERLSYTPHSCNE